MTKTEQEDTWAIKGLKQGQAFPRKSRGKVCNDSCLSDIHNSYDVQPLLFQAHKNLTM